MTDSVFSVPTEVEAALRWQNSPLVRAINEVVRASNGRSPRRIGDNAATLRVVGAADDLASVVNDIWAGERDGLGYSKGVSPKKFEKVSDGVWVRPDGT